jgi:hypothetical protein
MRYQCISFFFLKNRDFQVNWLWSQSVVEFCTSLYVELRLFEIILLTVQWITAWKTLKALRSLIGSVHIWDSLRIISIAQLSTMFAGQTMFCEEMCKTSLLCTRRFASVDDGDAEQVLKRGLCRWWDIERLHHNSWLHVTYLTVNLLV